MTHDVRILERDELRAAHDLFAGSLLFPLLDDQGWSISEPSYVPDRTFGVGDGGTLVGTAMAFPTATAVPGGAALPTAAVTRVGVRADNTRRGVLTAMMTRLLADAAERGEALASLRASEARIYGRFGYGVATRGRDLRVRRGGAGFRASAPGGGSVRLLERAEMVEVLAPLHERLALRRTGGILRRGPWWAGMLGRPLGERKAVLAAVHTGPDGDDGFAVAFPRESDGGFADKVLRVEDLHAADTAATAALWRFLLDVDLVGSVEGWLRPLDEPLELLLADPRDCTVTGTVDETWLRILDVPAALAARAWGRAEPVLLAVHDPLRPADAGVFRIGGDGAERVPGGVAPDLECDVAALGMAYLGDRSPSELAATGWWHVYEPSALPRADALFATATVPWCGTFF